MRPKILKAFVFLLGSQIVLQADSVDFNQASDLSLFQQEQSDFRTLAYGAMAGINGSGGVQEAANGFNSATYEGASFNFVQTGASITVSTLFKLDNSTPTLPLQRGDLLGTVGITPNGGDFLLNQPGDAHVSFELVNDGTSQFFELQEVSTINSGESGNLGIQKISNLTAGDWYQLSGTFTNNNGLDLTVTLNDYGQQGLNFVSTVASASTHLSDPVGLTSDTQVHAGFGIEGSDTSAADHFVVTPEPSSASLVVLTGLFLVSFEGFRRLISDWKRCRQ